MRPGAPRDNSRYCAFHKDNGHDTEECKHLRILVEELIWEGKLKEFVFADPGIRAGKYPVKIQNNTPTTTKGINVAEFVQTILGVRIELVSVKRPRIHEIHQIGATEAKYVPPFVTFRECDKSRYDNSFNDAVAIISFIDNF